MIKIFIPFLIILTMASCKSSSKSTLLDDELTSEEAAREFFIKRGIKLNEENLTIKSFPTDDHIDILRIGDVLTAIEFSPIPPSYEIRNVPITRFDTAAYILEIRSKQIPDTSIYLDFERNNGEEKIRINVINVLSEPTE